MTRTIPHSLAPVLEQLELYQADLVTTATRRTGPRSRYPYRYPDRRDPPA